MNKLTITAGTLVILSGIPGSGKSWLKANALKLPMGAWLSTDTIREQTLGGVVDIGSDGEQYFHHYQDANVAVFSVINTMARARLAEGLVTVIDATNLTDSDRGQWVKLAEEFGAKVQVLILDTPLDECIRRNASRSAVVPEHRLREMVSSASQPHSCFQPTSCYPHLRISSDTVLDFRPNELEHTRYDVIGDVHGLLEDLLDLLRAAGWRYEEEGSTGKLTHPEGRKLLFLGDLVDRGPHSLEVLTLVKQLVQQGVAKMVAGNHERKLVRFYEQALRDGIERWTSFANAETGVKLLNIPRDTANGLVAFIKQLPSAYTWEQDKVAFVHADVHRFDPLHTLASSMLFGQSRRHKVDSDAEYQARFDAGLNEYTLFRGHIPQTSPQPNVFSLERSAYQKGELVLLRLDAFLSYVASGMPSQAAFQAATMTQKCEFDFEAYRAKFELARGLDGLVTEKLATCQFDSSKLLRVYKYSKETFWNNSWNQSKWLLKARGVVLNPAGEIVSHPFDKCFNFRENGAGEGLPADLPVLEIEKLNGFLGIVSRHPFSRSELLLHTQGGFGGEFVGYIREYAYASSTRAAISKFLAKNSVTLMFEVLHPSDPHIIAYPDEMMGLHLIGVRGLKQGDEPWTEEMVDAAAAEMGLRRPSWKRTTLGAVLAKAKRDGDDLVRHEGWMVREDTLAQPFLFKLKTPYYLVTKFLGRMSSKKVRHMYGNPQDFKKTIDEEFFPLVDVLVQDVPMDTFLAYSDEERVPMVRSLIDKLI